MNHTPRPAVGRFRGKKVFRSVRTRAVALGVAVLLMVSLFAAAGLSRASPTTGVETDASSSLDVTAASGFKFVQSTYQQLPTGTNISVSFTDGDTLAHTFSILNRQGVVIPSSTTTTELEQLFTTYGALVSLNATSAGAVASGSFSAPATAGWYEFVCLEPGHFQEGMYGFVAFGMNLPANISVSSPSTGPGAAVFIISGTIVSLVVIALVLGFVFGQRRGALHEMPPERLGYPEPSAPAPESVAPPPIDHPKG